jgi:hypothetical protein
MRDMRGFLVLRLARYQHGNRNQRDFVALQLADVLFDEF